MKSMTGFGNAEFSNEDYSIFIEIKTINHRYKDFDFKLPRSISALEENMRKLITAKLTRGHIQVTVRYNSVAKKNAGVKYDHESALAYLGAIKALKADFPELKDDFTVTSLARAENVITFDEEPETLEELWAKVCPAFSEALEKLDISRSEEGERLKNDFAMRIALIEDYTAQISSLSEAIPKAYYEELLKRLAEFDTGVLSEDRIMTELAIYADRVNITEELVRLSSHIKNFALMAESNEPNGRKMDFLFQEINREANTIASKSNSFEISTIVVEIKSELEKMREQIQNIE